ncbi:NAD(P)-dependent oxidoreductase [Euzebya tangerina]|uniref:NAD(P)-dependent oxidoreductase n=1 Tax=Euzebya tangerina TaxID=591198 RepID=UPI000E323F10|nr:2-hydroxyacid dehydrogenase [Euzebya tangerina]
MRQHLAPVRSRIVDMGSRRPRVVIASRQGRAGLERHGLSDLEAVADLRFLSAESTIPTEEAIFGLRDAEIVAVTPLVSPDWNDRLLGALPNLRAISLHATGYDFIDIARLSEYDVKLTVLGEYSTRAVAEHTIGMLLALARRIHLANDRSRGLVAHEVSLRGFELAGRTLGVIGLGRIGSVVARLALAFDMEVVATDRHERTVDGVTMVDFDELLSRSHCVAITASMDHDAQPIIGRAELSRLPKGAVVVNTSRSGLVDTEAIAGALRSRHLRGYAVDDAIFDPLEHGDLLREGRVMQTGHSAWWADEALDRGSRHWVESLCALAEGRPVPVIDGRPRSAASNTA